MRVNPHNLKFDLSGNSIRTSRTPYSRLTAVVCLTAWSVTRASASWKLGIRRPLLASARNTAIARAGSRARVIKCNQATEYSELPGRLARFADCSDRFATPARALSSVRLFYSASFRAISLNRERAKRNVARGNVYSAFHSTDGRTDERSRRSEAWKAFNSIKRAFSKLQLRAINGN